MRISETMYFRARITLENKGEGGGIEPRRLCLFKWRVNNGNTRYNKACGANQAQFARR